MSLTPLPPAPSISDPANFPALADAFVAALGVFQGQVNSSLQALGLPTYSRTVDVVDLTGLALATAYVNGQTVDGQVLTTGMRILRAVPGGDATNGIYDAPASGTASRSSDANSSALFTSGLLVSVTRGTLGKGATLLHSTAPGFTLGVTALTVVPFAHTKQPTYQTLTSGSGATYTPSNALVKHIDVEAVGAGGGGGGSGTSGGNTGGVGGDTTFNGVVAKGGLGAAGNGGAGGVSGTGTAAFRSRGGAGSTGIIATAANAVNGSNGGSSKLGGGGIGDTAADANSGGGGGGALQSTGAGNAGGGGGGGEWWKQYFAATTYLYTISAGGTGGTTGTSGNTGKAGGSGKIIVKEYYT
jgi:hypothetical protein